MQIYNGERIQALQNFEGDLQGFVEDLMRIYGKGERTGDLNPIYEDKDLYATDGIRPDF